jgi:hypothetical protein
MGNGEQSSENYRIIKINMIMAFQTPMIFLRADVEQLSSKINKSISNNTIQKYYELLSVTGQLSQTFTISKK